MQLNLLNISYVQVAVFGFEGMARMMHDAGSHLQTADRLGSQIEPLPKWYVDSEVNQSGFHSLFWLSDLQQVT